MNKPGTSEKARDAMKELTNLLKAMPTNMIGKDLENIYQYFEKGGKFHDGFNAISRLDYRKIEIADRQKLVKYVSTRTNNSNQLSKVYEFFSDKVDDKFFFETFIFSPYLMEILIPMIMNNSEKASILLTVLESKEKEDRTHCTNKIRRALFHFAFIRKDSEFCFNIIKSIHPTLSPLYFAEFTSYLVQMPQLASGNEKLAKEIFQYVLDISTFFKDSSLYWFISYAILFTPLVYGKSIHPAIFSYISQCSNNIQIKFAAKKFLENSKSIYNHELSLADAPPLLRPYYLSDKWKITADALLDINSSEKSYNILLYLCNQKPSEAIKILSNLPYETSLPFYYIIATNNENEEYFHNAVNAIFNMKKSKKVHKYIIPVFEKAVKTSFFLLKAHYNQISTLKISECCNIVAYMIKANKINFSKLWKVVKNMKISDCKPIIEQGIFQIQRKSRSHENAAFILSILKNYFCDPSGNINWSAVADEFPNDIDISNTIFLNDHNENSSTKEANPLISWSDQLLQYISISSANFHRIFVIPYLLLITGNNSIPIEKTKWAISNLPVYQCKAESILEGYALFEIARHILSQSLSNEKAIQLLHDIFSFETTEIGCYSAAFAHAAIALKINSQDSMSSLLKSCDSKHLMIARASKLAINFLRYHGFKFQEEKIPIVEKLKDSMVDQVLGLLSSTSSNINDSNEKLSKQDEKFIKILSKAHKLSTNKIKDLLQKKEFSDYEELRNHFILLSISSFLLLPSRTIPKSSIERCLSLLGGQNQIPQINFALLALSQIPTKLDNDFSKYVKFHELHQALCKLANKQNNKELIISILNESKDYNIIFELRYNMSFIGKDIVKKFIEKTAPDTKLEILFNSIDIFEDKELLLCVFSYIRKKDITEIIINNQYQRLRTALAKFDDNEIKTNILQPFDDFALLCSFEKEMKLSIICNKLQSSQSNPKFTYPSLFLLLLKQEKTKLSEFPEAMLAITIEKNDHNPTNLRTISLFYLVLSDDEPFHSIKIHFQGNPLELNYDILSVLMPSLLTKYISKSSHIDHIQKYKNDLFIDEAVLELQHKNAS